MGNGYVIPASDPIDQLMLRLRDIERRVSESESFTGAEIADALQTLTDLVNGLLTQVNGVFSGYIQAGGNANIGGDINLTGDLYTPHGRATPVVTSYVAAYINSDGRLGATPSGAQFKQDVKPRGYTLADCRLFQIVQYRLIAAVELLGDEAVTEVGVIAQQLLKAGFPEFVVCDESGTPITVTYERMVVAAIGGLQDAANQIDAIKERLDRAGL